MGGGFYFVSDREERATTLGYHTKSRDEIFTQSRVNEIHELMRPSQALLRESRDSEDHPNSIPIILGLDFTGSMGNIPHRLIQDGLPTLMGGIINDGIVDAQLLFLGIGDHECDIAPLQVGQFESSDELIDNWLTKSWIEGRGGSNDGESYLLAWYFAAMHTVTDAFEKRNQKGFLITIGDEPSLRTLPSHSVNKIMENGCQTNYTDRELLTLAQEKYNVFHIEMGNENGKARNYWRSMLGDRCIPVDRNNGNVAETIRKIITDNYVLSDVIVTYREPGIDFGF